MAVTLVSWLALPYRTGLSVLWQTSSGLETHLWCPEAGIILLVCIVTSYMFQSVSVLMSSIHPLKNEHWSRKHEKDTQSHLSSCLLQLEGIREVFQTLHVFRCQILISIQYPSYGTLVVHRNVFFSYIVGLDCRLMVLLQLLCNVTWTASESFRWDYELTLSTEIYWHAWLQDGILYSWTTGQHPSSIFSIVICWIPWKPRSWWLSLRSTETVSSGADL